MPATLTAPSPTELAACPTQLSAEQIAHYRRDGFIAFHSVLSPDEVAKGIAGLSNIVEALRHEHRTAENQYGIYWKAPDSPASIQFQRGYAPDSDNDPDAILKVRKFHDVIGFDPFLSSLAKEQPRIQGVLAGLLGPDPILSQDMALINPPRIGTGKPWHQDDAYFKIVPLDAVCGVWIALDEAGVENGCMNFLPGWNHRGALRHYHGNDCEILPDRLGDSETRMCPVPLPPGGAVFFMGTMPHMTKPNTSDLQRRALQYHYRSAHSRITTQDEYDAIFVESDGTPASCAAASKRGF